MYRTATLLALSLALSSSAMADTNVSVNHKFSWSENCGWMNWRDAGMPAGTQGARIGTRVLSGFVWCENTGWINLGNGVPANGLSYANTTGADFGVNHDPNTGLLSGLGWGENVGWINFDIGASAGSLNAARIAVDEPRRFLGYAWGENIGWINFDGTGNYVGISCPADFNLDGELSVQDIFDFLNAWFAGDIRADFNGQSGLAVQDIFDFLNAWFAGCD